MVIENFHNVFCIIRYHLIFPRIRYEIRVWPTNKFKHTLLESDKSQQKKKTNSREMVEVAAIHIQKPLNSMSHIFSCTWRYVQFHLPKYCEFPSDFHQPFTQRCLLKFYLKYFFFKLWAILIFGLKWDTLLSGGKKWIAILVFYAKTVVYKSCVLLFYTLNFVRGIFNHPVWSFYNPWCFSTRSVFLYTYI